MCFNVSLLSTYGPGTGLNYASWMLFCVPNMLLATLVVAGAMIMQSLDWRQLCSKFVTLCDGHRVIVCL